MSGSYSSRTGTINRGMAYVDQAIDAYVIENIDLVASAESRDDTSHWNGLVAKVLEEVEAMFPPEVAEEVGAYAIDRVTARRSESPLFTDELSCQFIKEHKRMPEGPEWIAYIKKNSNPAILQDMAY